MLRVSLDGLLVPLNQHSVISESEFTFEFAMTDDYNDSNWGLDPSTKRNFSSDISFYDDTATQIKADLITNNTAGDRKIILTITDDCCTDSAQILYRGKIYKKDLQWCAIDSSAQIDCEVTVKSDEDTETSTAYDCFRSALVNKRDTIISGKRFDEYPHSFVNYCKEVRPRIIQDFFYTFFFILANALALLAIGLKIWGKVIGFIGKVAGLLGLTGISNTLKGWEKMVDIFEDTVSNYISGCGKGNVTPKLKDLILNSCAQCNLSFSSTFLNNPDSVYWNAVLYKSDAELPGFGWWDSSANAPFTDINDDYYRLNSPVWNGMEFMNMLRKVFASQWWIDGNVLYFEPIIPNSTNLWVDFTIPSNYEKITKLCFEPSDKLQAAGLRFTAAQDTSEMIGDEGHYLYNDLIDWTNPIHAVAGYNRTDILGLKDQTIDFAPARFKRDGITRDILRFWNEFEVYRNSSAFGIYLQIIKLPQLIISKINPFTSGYENRKHDLLLQQGVARTAKLLILEEPDVYDAKVLKEGPYNIDGTNDCYLYNSPFWFADDQDILGQNKPYRSPNLFDYYDRTNPNRVTGTTNVTFTIELIYDCDILSNLYDFINSSSPKNLFIRLPFEGSNYNSKPLHTVTVNENTILIKGSI